MPVLMQSRDLVSSIAISSMSFVVMQLHTHNNLCTGPQLADCDCFATFNTRRIILGSSGVNWNVVGLQAPLFFGLTFIMHTVLHQRMTVMHSGAVPLQLVFLCNSKPQNKFSNSKAVVCYVEYPCMTCSFQVLCISTHKMAYRRDCNARLEP